MMIKQFFATLVFCLFATQGLFAQTQSPSALMSAINLQDPPWETPDLLFSGDNGQEITLHRYLQNDLKGRFVLLTVWATWCIPCLAEMPSLDALQGLMGQDLAVIALSQDRDGATLVPAYYKRHELPNLKVYVDAGGRAIRKLRLRGIPSTLLIDPEGREVGRLSKRIDWSDPANIAALKDLMGKYKTAN